MPQHDPTPPGQRERELAYRRFKALMSWMWIVAIGAVVLALLYLWLVGGPLTIHMVIATTLGVSLTVLLGTGLMGLVFMSSRSGHDEQASSHTDDDRN
jgi:hypothetical protein